MSDDCNGSCEDDSLSENVETHDVTLSIDAAFGVLADEERRVILDTLMTSSDNCVSIDEVVDQLVQWKTDQTGKYPNPDSIEMRIHHVHIPKLSGVGVAEYDARSGMIRYWGNTHLEEWLQRAQEMSHD